MADKMQMYVEVKDKNGKTVAAKMSTQDFAKMMIDKAGSGRNSTIQDNIKSYNTGGNSEGNIAKLVVEVNGKRIGENMNLKAKSILESWKKLKGIKESMCETCESDDCKCNSPEDGKEKIVDSETEENDDEMQIGEPKVMEASDDEIDAMEKKKMKDYLEDAFDKYNDLMEEMAKINVRDEDIKKEWSKVDKAFDGILKIYKNKYGK